MGRRIFLIQKMGFTTKILFIFMLAICGLSTFEAKAQSGVFTFECVCANIVAPDCDICNTSIQSRYFSGLYIKKAGVGFRWIDAPYIVKWQGNNAVIQEIIPNAEVITINLFGTAFGTLDSFKMAIDCRCSGGEIDGPLFYASDSIDFSPIYVGDTLLIVGRNDATVTFDSLTKKYIVDVVSGSSSGVTELNGLTGIVDIIGAGINVVTQFGQTITITGTEVGLGTVTDFSANDLTPLFTTTEATPTTTPVLSFVLNTQTANTIFSGPATGAAADPTFRALVLADISGLVTANNGLSDNEAGGNIFRLGNRFMNGSDGLFSNDRKVNINNFSLFIGDNSDSTLLNVDGLNGRVGVRTSAPGRDFVVNGEVEIKDLTTTTPDRIVGADGNGVLSEITVGSGLSLTGGTLTSSGAANYQTWRDQGVAATAQPNANFLSTATINPTLTNDGANSETEATFDVVANSIGNTQIRQGVARSVIGVTGNATANVADIQGAADQVLRVTTAGTALSFGTVATGGITNDAVTYAKIQNAAANNVLLGNNNGAGTDYEELGLAALYTLLGLTGTINRFALWTGANTLASDAAFTFDGANDRATFTGTVAGGGPNGGILNLNTAAIAGSTTFLRMSGNITNNLIAEMTNANNAAATASTILNLSVGGANAGDAVVQFTVNGQMSHVIGIDNTDDRFKITPNASAPGGNAGMGIIVRDNNGTGNTGINIDFPTHAFVVKGRARLEQMIGEGNLWGAGNFVFGNGAGTGPTFGGAIGSNNFLMFRFTTGTTPTANGNIFTATYPLNFPTISGVSFSAGRDAGGVGGDNAATDIQKFKINSSGPNDFILKAVGTLSASTTYEFTFSINGY